MRSSSLIVPALGLAFGSLVACGGADAVNFFAIPEAGGSNNAGAGASNGDGTSSAAGASNVAGTSSGDDDSSAGSSNSAGTVNAAGTSNVAGADGDAANAGATTVAGAGSPASAGTSGAPSDAPCGPVMDLSASGNQKNVDLQSAGPVCLLISDDIVGWGCSNFEGRTVKVNGVQVRCAQLPLPDKLHGGYYFDISAGDHAYASMYWF